MNTQVFSQAKAAYADGQYTLALQYLTQCLEDRYAQPQAGEYGLLYHQIGNCLVKLGNHAEAIQSYTQATADVAYGNCGALNYNLGMSYAALGDYEDAINHFEVAVSDGKYDTPYKAFLAMGNAMMKLGKSAEAGIAFRAAALDEHNPNPARALLNLGVCFMALNRPADAVVSYESALQFDMDAALKNKLYANLGQAYVANGQMQKAAHAFEEALADKTYFLSDSASVDYQRAVAAVAQGSVDPGANVLPAAAEEQDYGNDDSGLDVVGYDQQDSYEPYNRGYDDGYGQAYDNQGYNDGYGYDDGYGQADNTYTRNMRGIRNGRGTGVSFDNNSNSDFFDPNVGGEDQWNTFSNAAPKKRRLGLKIISGILVLLIALLGVGAYFYVQGWGYPDQQTVVTQLFADPDGAVDTLFADGINQATAEALAAQVVKDKAVSIDGVNKEMSNSTVYATTTLVEGGKVTYKISLIRDMLTWKVSNVEIYHSSK